MMVETRESYDMFMKRMMEEQSRELTLRKVKKSIWVTFEKEGIHIEFFIFKRWLESLYQDNILKLDYKSCEMMADDLAKKIKDKYPGRRLAIDVSEDGENGCHVEYPEEY